MSHSCLCQCLKLVAKNLLFKFDFPESKNLDALLYVYSLLVPKNCQVKVCCRGIFFLPKLSVIYYYEETIFYLTNSVWLRPRFQLSRKAWQAVLFPHGPTEAGLENFQINKKINYEENVCGVYNFSKREILYVPLFFFFILQVTWSFMSCLPPC